MKGVCGSEISPRAVSAAAMRQGIDVCVKGNGGGRKGRGYAGGHKIGGRFFYAIAPFYANIIGISLRKIRSLQFTRSKNRDSTQYYSEAHAFRKTRSCLPP